MGTIYLTGHTGSENRGCEAIVRSTTKILKSIGVKKITLMSFAYEQDKTADLTSIVNVVPYCNYSSFTQRLFCAICKRIFNNYIIGEKIKQKSLIENLQKGDMIFNIGGDTYCYHTPVTSYAMNKFAYMKEVPTVFWGCSIDERLNNNRNMQDDLNRYNSIVTREQLSEKIIKSNINSQNIYQCCDPAFELDIKETALPDLFLENNTVGINLSPLVFKNGIIKGSKTLINTIHLINFIINNTSMNICLIPHVYNIERNTQDIAVLKQLYHIINNEERITIIDKELSCEELKYIISKCRFFIGARTHSIIAAYSTCVPAIALSYSIKSRGIALDLFGTEEGYAIPWQQLNNDADLTDAFISLMQNESFIKKRYEQILPSYKQSIFTTAKKIIGDIDFEL